MVDFVRTTSSSRFEALKGCTTSNKASCLDRFLFLLRHFPTHRQRSQSFAQDKTTAPSHKNRTESPGISANSKLPPS